MKGLTLVDTSVWIDHLNKPIPDLLELAEADAILTHPFVFGELFVGRAKGRSDLLANLAAMNSAVHADESEVLHMADHYGLRGSGLGWIDCHILASARLSKAELLTHDRAMKMAWDKIQQPKKRT